MIEEVVPEGCEGADRISRTSPENPEQKTLFLPVLPCGQNISVLPSYKNVFMRCTPGIENIVPGSFPCSGADTGICQRSWEKKKKKKKKEIKVVFYFSRFYIGQKFCFSNLASFLSLTHNIKFFM